MPRVAWLFSGFESYFQSESNSQAWTYHSSDLDSWNTLYTNLSPPMAESTLAIGEVDLVLEIFEEKGVRDVN